MRITVFADVGLPSVSAGIPSIQRTRYTPITRRGVPAYMNIRPPMSDAPPTESNPVVKPGPPG